MVSFSTMATRASVVVPIATVLLLLLFVSQSRAENVVRISPHGDCTAWIVNANGVPAANASIPAVTQSIVDWKGIVLILAIGGVAILLALVHRLVRTHIYYDAHLLDTFYDAGGDVGVGMVTTSVVTRWTWTMSYSWSVYSMAKYGAVGQFWFAAGLVVQLLLFAVVACEIRIKAPGAKTFLQVIYARFGAPSHVIIILFALFLNIVISSMIMYEGTNIMYSLVGGVKKEIIALILAIVIALFTVIGGVGGSLYVGYIASVFIVSVALFFYVEVFYDIADRQEAPFGSWKDIYKITDCLRAHDAAENDANSPMTFLSRGGMIEGVLLILSGFSSVFLNQSFWQVTVTSKPTQTVWGFIMAAITWFALPFGFAFALGSAYQVWTVTTGAYPVPEEQAMDGLVPVYVTQRLLGQMGDYLMLVLTTLVVVTTSGGEVLGASSIIVYDIYMTYISPFKPSSVTSGMSEYHDVSVRSRRAIHNEEYLEYDKRCMMLKHVTVIILSLLLIPFAIVLFVLGLDLLYLFKFLGVVCGGCVIPVALAITWHRATGLGMALGSLAGFIAGAVAWLVYSSTFQGGLENFYVNTGRWQPMLTGCSSSLGIGGLICILCSLCCGGCDQDRVEEEEWEKTRAIDNQILPWAVKYAPEFKNMKLKGIPHFFAVRRTFKCAEISAYIIGVLLAVVAILVWPACMLLEEDWSESVFSRWNILVLVWLCISAAFLCLCPLIGEIMQVCRQAYYNRKWSQRSHTDTRTLEEEPAQPERPLHQDAHSIKTVESDFHSTMGRDSGLDDTSRRERWKTFIRLD